MHRQLLLVLPALIGGAAMAWSVQRSYFLSELNATGFLWAVALLGPFVFVGVVSWRTRQGFTPGALAVAPALLLTASPITCFADRFGEGCQYLLALSPIYLWAVVALAALLDLASWRSISPDAV